MKFITRWAFRLFILTIVLAVALVLLKDIVAKAFVEYRIRKQTGMDVKIGRLELGLSAPMVTLEDFKLYNLPEYGGSPFLDIPDLYVEYDPYALASGRLHLRLVRIYLAEMNIVEAKNGHTNLVLNLDRLSEPSAKSISLIGSRLDFAGLDTLNFTIGKVRYTSLRRPGSATEVNLGYKNQVATGIKSLTDLSNLVIKTLFRNGITVINQSPKR